MIEAWRAEVCLPDSGDQGPRGW